MDCLMQGGPWDEGGAVDADVDVDAGVKFAVRSFRIFVSSLRLCRNRGCCRKDALVLWT